MKYIGIIAAEDKEVEAIKSLMLDVIEENVYNLTIFKGKIKDFSCLLVKAGIGKVNAGRTAQIIIDKFEISAVINVGAAGATSEKLKIGDVVISTSLIQHDFDVTAFGREKGFIPGVGKELEADSNLLKLCEEAVSLSDINYKKGIIATGDSFVSSSEEKLELSKTFEALCVEMEGGAIAQVCSLCDVPFVVIRSISDEVKGDARVDFEEFLETASKRCAEMIYNMIENF